MDIHQELCERITKSLDFFSFKVTSQVEDFFYSPEHEQVVIHLKDGADRAQFCHFLAATGLFTERDEFRVMFKPK